MITARTSMIPRILAAFMGVMLMGAAARADDTIPGDDIFGFTAPTDVGEPGEVGFAIETTNRSGKGRGTFSVTSTKYEFSKTLTDRVWLAVSPFSRRHIMDGLPGIGPNQDCKCFEGASTELMVLAVKRSEQQPFAVAFSFEPNWTKIDPMTGLKANSLSAEMKMFVDAPIAKDWFWGLNLNYDPSATQTAVGGKWTRTATTNVSTAITHELWNGFFVGAEARYQMAFGSYGLKKSTGSALFIGPTMAVELTDEVVLNLTWQPQVVGKAKGSRLPLDNINFEHTNFRLRLSYTPHTIADAENKIDLDRADDLRARIH